MKVKEAMLCWNDGGEVKIVNHPDSTRSAKHLRLSVGACFSEFDKLSENEKVANLIINGLLCVKDGVKVEEVLIELNKVDEIKAEIEFHSRLG